MNLIDGLLAQMNRVREVIVRYEALPDGAGKPGAMLMRMSIREAELAMGGGDVVEMVRAYKDLEGCE